MSRKKMGFSDGVFVGALVGLALRSPIVKATVLISTAVVYYGHCRYGWFEELPYDHDLKDEQDEITSP